MKYLPVCRSDRNDCDVQQPARKLRAQSLLLAPSTAWVITGFLSFVSLLLAVLLERSYQETARLGTFAGGYATEFGPSREYMKVTQRRFTGSPAFNDKGQVFVPNPGDMKFVGDPAVYPEIDYNWDNLTWGRYILITRKEAVASWGEPVDQYWDHQRGGYVAGLDVFHTLHCLNNLRKALNPTHYGAHGPDLARRASPGNTLLHQDHCIEQLRQYIMCSGDMSPIPTKFYPSLGRNYVDSDVLHTCRDFEALHSWLVGRYVGSATAEARS